MLSGSAALYGKGIFTTAAVYDGAPFLWEKHWRRLTDNAARLGIDLSEYSEELVKQVLERSVAESGIVNGRARVTFFDERASSIWPVESNKNTSLHIITGELRQVPDDLRLTVSPYPVNSRSPLAGIKSCNYLEDLLAIEEARKRGFHEAVRVNERGIIASGCMANILWLKDGHLHTPSLTTGCLAGTTREFVIENIDCSEVEAGIDELNSADTVFLTSAGIGVVAVSEFEDRHFAVSHNAILDLMPVPH